MDEQAMQSKAKESKTPPKIEAALFVPDPALDSLYRQAVVVAKEFGWPVPVRGDFARQYKAEISASRKNQGAINRPKDW